MTLKITLHTFLPLVEKSFFKFYVSIHTQKLKLSFTYLLAAYCLCLIGINYFSLKLYQLLETTVLVIILSIWHDSCGPISFQQHRKYECSKSIFSMICRFQCITFLFWILPHQIHHVSTLNIFE